MRGILVVSEVAMSLVLLISAALLIRSLVGLLRSDLGIRTEKVLTMEAALPRDRYNKADQLDFYARLLSRVESLPGVVEAGATDSVPISGRGASSTAIQIVGRAEFQKGKELTVERRVATPGYFNAIGTALRRGRLFTERDDANAPRVVLTNETMAKRFFPGEEPIGQRLRLGEGANSTLEVIGVVADVRNEDLTDQIDPTVYLPYSQNPLSTMNLIIHTSQEPGLLAAAAQDEIRALDRSVPVSQVKTLSRTIDERISPKRLLTYMLGGFAGIALLMASLGLYGVMSYMVVQRTREIGIRMALGARAGDVSKLIVARGLKLTMIGLTFGLIGAAVSTRALSYFLFGVTSTDPLTFAGTAMLLSGIALAASYLPARRAARVDPMAALRHE